MNTSANEDYDSRIDKQCVLHVTDVYPYFYVPLSEYSVGEDGSKQNEANCKELENRIESLLRNNNTNSKIIKDTQVCKAFEFYGYSIGYKPFLKIRLHNPHFVRKVADFLSSKEINLNIQPYEAHIPYLLAFLIDYNLFGCDYVHFDSNSAIFKENQMNCENIWISARHIENRSKLLQTSIHNQIFEPGMLAEVTSLSQLRATDSLWRRRVGKEMWCRDPALKPKFQESARNWNWVQKRESLKELKNFIQKPTTKLSVLNDFPELPLASELTLSDFPPQYESPESDISPAIHTVLSDMSQSNASCISLTENPSFFSTGSESSTYNSQPALFDFAPTTSDVENTIGVFHYTTSFYSNPKDVDAYPYKFSNKELRLKSHNLEDIPHFYLKSPALPQIVFQRFGSSNKCQFGLPCAPSSDDVIAFCNPRIIYNDGNDTKDKICRSRNDPDSFPKFELSVLIISIHTNTRKPKASPDSDDIRAIFYQLGSIRGVVSVDDILRGQYKYTKVETEIQLLDELIKIVRDFNPDILAGFEEKNTWSFCRQRYFKITGNYLYNLIGRVKIDDIAKPNNDVFGEELLCGRHMFNLWSLFKKNVTAPQYTLESLSEFLLKEQTPHYTNLNLKEWWLSGDMNAMNNVVCYSLERISLSLRLLKYTDIISKTCEMSRIIGVDFYSSLTRGSQFQVESVLCRLTRTQEYLLISPSKEQVANQHALEYIPLVMEPLQDFYTDPVCVLDFRSLYPSIIIAYNLCYSTCIGRLPEKEGTAVKLGVKENIVDPALLKMIGIENIYIAPNRMVYVSPKVRCSLLAQMLGDILDTRFMLQKSVRSERNKQLAMKFIANVTYGYTSASFSGRMPLAELADSIVLAGREILQFSIAKIENEYGPPYGAKVVYGDTDSLFVKLPHLSREQAFIIGESIAHTITNCTPDPILLKLEKIYHPCILLSKKRYVGRSYERTNATPKFDAKGTETIRRDNIPITQTIERNALEVLFDTSDLSRVKKYVQSQWRKMLSGKISIQQFVFSRQVKRTDSESRSLGAIVSRNMDLDSEYKERVPFLVTVGPPGSRLSDRVVHPSVLLSNLDSNHLISEDKRKNKKKIRAITLDYDYYITKVIIPPLERLFGLTGANINKWYLDMPKPKVRSRRYKDAGLNALGTIAFESGICCICSNRRDGRDIMCARCRDKESSSLAYLENQMHDKEARLSLLHKMCNICSGKVPPPSFGNGYDIHPCTSLDCKYMYERCLTFSELRDLEDLVLFRR